MSQRPVLPIRTELPTAPTGEALIEAVESFECRRENDCRYTNPYKDRHHEIFGSDLTDAEELLKSHPDFISDVCRCIHQRIHRTWDRSEPISDDFAVGYLLAPPVNLTANKRKKLKELRSGHGRNNSL